MHPIFHPSRGKGGGDCSGYNNRNTTAKQQPPSQTIFIVFLSLKGFKVIHTPANSMNLTLTITANLSNLKPSLKRPLKL